MSNHYQISQVQSDQQINQILSLQHANLKASLTPELIEQEGFVTCEHNFDLLKKMNHPNGHIIALHESIVVGYCLIMESVWRDELEVLQDMFLMIEKTEWLGETIKSGEYITMGQVCIHKDHRKKGLFKMLYQHFKKCLSNQFKYCITEIASSNHRSLNAHAAVGFENLFSYQASDGKNWESVIWDWTK